MNPEWSLKGGLRGIRTNVQQKGEDLLMECRGDIEMGVHGNGDVCQLQEAWDHSTVLLCTIIPLNPALLLSLASYYPTQLTHCHTLVQLLCLLMTQACHSFSGYTVNTGAPVPRGPNGLISTVYSCGLFYSDSQKAQRGLCERQSFSCSDQQDPPSCTLLCFSFESSPVPPTIPPPQPSRQVAVFSLPACHLSLTKPRLLCFQQQEFLHPVICHHSDSSPFPPLLISLSLPFS